MEMDSEKIEDTALEPLFQAGKARAPKPTDAFLARLSADADAALRQPLATVPISRPSLFCRFKTVFAASGLSGAAALGVWIGFAMPELVTTVSPLSEEVAGLSVFLPGADLSVFIE